MPADVSEAFSGVLSRRIFGVVLPLRFVPYHLLDDTPNVVVDGSPTASTRLTLSHWPGSPTPVELLDDLSAQIAFRALDRPALFDGVDLVSNNHFDQDGLMSAYALVEPEAALARREQVIDVASAGDFATFTNRDSMRVSMAIAAMDDPERSPLDASVHTGGYMEQCGRLYEATLELVTAMLDDPQSVRHLWQDEDAHLDESLAAIDGGAVSLTEHPDIDLAVCVVPDDWSARIASRFTVSQRAAVHPAAIHNRTSCMRIVTSQGGHHRLECRYETWVMYRSRPLEPRPDLRVLANRLDAVEGRPVWHADAPGSLTPVLDSSGTKLSLDRFLAEASDFLRDAPPAWDPFANR
jgi:hypothetical protein